MSDTIELNPVLEAALEYADMGLAVVWLAPGTKRPMAKGWTEAPRPTPEELRATYTEGMNVGLRCGPVSPMRAGECLCVLDLDLSTDDAAEQAAAWDYVRELVGHEMAAQPTVVSGSGRGRHWYMSWPVQAIQDKDKARVVLATSASTVQGSGKKAWQVEVLLAGAQAVANPSVHPDTGREYEMVGPVHTAPVGVVQAVRKANSREKIAGLMGGVGSTKALGGHMNTAPLQLAALGGAEDSAALAMAELMRELAAESAFASVMTGPEGVPDFEHMKSALAVIPPSIGRADWMRVVWAVRAHGHEGCYQAAEEWSKGSAEKWNPQDFDGVWRAQSRGPAVEAGTLYHIARSHGWKGSLRRQQTSAVILPPEGVPVAGGVLATPTQLAPTLGGAPALAVTAPVALAAGYGGGLDVAGDLTNGVAFASDWRGRLLYVEATKGWMQWTGSRWVACATATVWECAKKTAGRLLVEAASGYSAQPSSNERKAALKAASDLMKSDRRMEAMLHMAQSEGGLWEKDPSVFDNDPMVLACPNGVLNLRTGALVPASPELRVSRLAARAYNPEATCPGFVQFINDIFLGDAEMVAFMQRQLGYCLTGDVTEEKMFFWYGHGSNGKSVLGEVVGGVMGEYSAQISAALLRRNGNGNTSAAERAVFRLRGARLVQMNELAEGERWDDARLKEITSREPISARQLYGEDFDFIPTHKLVVRGNNKPIIRDDSHGTWRRIVLCGFERQYAEHEKNPHLAAQLVEHEGEGILAWLVARCLEWQRTRLAVPVSVQDLTAAYKADSDVFGQWVSECCDTSDPTAETDRKSLRSNYEAWCTANGYAYPLTAKRMSQKLAERGFPVVYGGKRYQGLRLHPTQH